MNAEELFIKHIPSFLASAGTKKEKVPFIDFTQCPPKVFKKTLVSIDPKEKISELVRTALKEQPLIGGVEMPYPRLLTRIFDAQTRLSDDAVRDEATKLEEEINGTLEIKECKTLEEIYKAFSIQNKSCMQLCERRSTSISVSGLWKEFGIHPSMFFYFWPEISVWMVSLKKRPISRFFLYQNEIYDSPKTTVYGYAKLISERIKRDYKNWTPWNAWWDITKEFIIPGSKIQIRGRTKIVCPLPYCDSLNKNNYNIAIGYFKDRNEFLITPRKVLEADKIWNISRVYSYSGWLIV